MKSKPPPAPMPDEQHPREPTKIEQVTIKKIVDERGELVEQIDTLIDQHGRVVGHATSRRIKPARGN